jgi:hypothetical protein
MSDEELRSELPPADRREERRRARRARRQREQEEKEEKFEGAFMMDDKTEEKEEKGEGWGRDPLGGIVWAMILISVGVIFLAQTLGYIEWGDFGGIWNLIFMAIGLILLFEVLVRLLVPSLRRPVLGTLIGACILLAIGLGGILGSMWVLGVALIVIGVIVLLSGLFRGRL